MIPCQEFCLAKEFLTISHLRYVMAEFCVKAMEHLLNSADESFVLSISLLKSCFSA